MFRPHSRSSCPPIVANERAVWYEDAMAFALSLSRNLSMSLSFPRWLRWCAPWCALVGCALLVASSAVADDSALAGKWKLLLLPFGEDEFAIVEAKPADGKLAAELVNAQAQVLPGAKVNSLTVQDGRLELVIGYSGQELKFSGGLSEDQTQARGAATFRGTTYPARLERTEATEVAKLGPSKISTEMMAARREADPKARIAKLQELVKAHAGAPGLQNVYDQILRTASSADWSAEQVNELMAQWFKETEPYGDAWSAEIRKRALQALANQEKYAEAAFKLGEEAYAALPQDASTESRADLLAILATTARQAGKADVADEADRKLAELESVLDEEYLKKTPPFAPAQYAGRKDAKANQVVVMELFTGAQCPPCVAADVAFDALLKTYQPTEFIGLQYHLHIPGPDPLTNEDAVERSKYYAVRGTPSTYFNGVSEAGGGGGMAQSEGKYAQFQQSIDPRLETIVAVDLDLEVRRDGETISLKASAKAPQPKADGDEAKADDAKAEEAKADDAKADDAEKDDAEKAADDKKEDAAAEEPKPRELRLRLVLIEDVVKYVGGNRLRFHHHVVRGMPGGAEGAAFDGDVCTTEATVNLGELRESLNAYLDRYASERPFPKARPDIPLENLAVVALVQDDATKQILQSVLMPVPASGAE